jgi:pimeloyl-ACP methyl ester carboxylesterase
VRASRPFVLSPEGSIHLRRARIFLDLARRSSVPMLIVYGSQTPPRSRSEMDALASVPGVQRAALPLGKLSVHEEFPDLVAEAIKSFIQRDC